MVTSALELVGSYHLDSRKDTLAHLSVLLVKTRICFVPGFAINTGDTTEGLDDSHIAESIVSYN